MRCARRDRDFTPKNRRRRFCSDKCRAAAWQRQRQDTLAVVEEQLARAMTRVRVLRGTKVAG